MIKMLMNEKINKY